MINSTLESLVKRILNQCLGATSKSAQNVVQRSKDLTVATLTFSVIRWSALCATLLGAGTAERFLRRAMAGFAIHSAVKSQKTQSKEIRAAMSL